MNPWWLRRARDVLYGGGVIAYATEAVWGLGCLPDELAAVQRILAIKRRPAHKGLILIAAHWHQLAPWVALKAPPAAASAHWPGHVTCLLPAAAGVSPLIRGQHTRIAVRISAHPGVRALCEAAGSALISTSANRAGRPAARSALEVRRQLAAEPDLILPGQTGGAAQASRIIDPDTDRIIRA